jgi:hypothetical protein
MNQNNKLIKTLPKKWQRIAIGSRIALLLVFIAVATYISYAILFPSRTFEFFFRTPGAMKNTLVEPRNINGDIDKGNISANEISYFNTNLVGDFSHATVYLKLEKKSNQLDSGSINVRKSFRAFFFPQGEDMPFPDGTLLSVDNSYFIVSQGKLREFKNSQIMQTLGFSSQMFAEVLLQSLKTTPPGEEIVQAQYPEGTYFFIDEDYYQLTEGSLKKFVSENAFLSRADVRQAIKATGDIFEKLPLSEEYLGFRDGKLVSSNESVFILSKGKYYPIDNTLTFQAMGLSWDDVLPISAEELSAYEKQKLFTQDQPHPDGIVMTDRKTNNSFIIDNGKKRLLPNQVLANSYLRGATPVFVDSDSLTTKAECKTNKLFNPFNKEYRCEIPIDKIHEFSGNDYQFELLPDKDVRLNYASVTLHKVIGKDNFTSSLSEIKGRIRNTYYGTQQ